LDDDDDIRPPMSEVLAALRDVYDALHDAPLASPTRPANIQRALSCAFPILQAHGIEVVDPERR
jgi:hypothetical protein